jgi:hypothetical protein
MTDHDGAGRATAAAGEWRDQYGDVADGVGKPHRLGQYVEDERNARVIRSYEPELIPGLLQLPETTSAIAQEYFPHLSDAARAHFVEARNERRKVLDRSDAPRLSVLVNERALRKEWGSPEVRRAQLDALIDALDGVRPNVEVRIMPAAREHLAGTRDDAFVVMSLKEGSDVLWVETKQRSERIDVVAEAEHAARSFERLARDAFAPAEARGLIKEIRESVG